MCWHRLYASTIDSFLLAFIDPCGGQLSKFYLVRDAIAMSTRTASIYSDEMISSDLYRALQAAHTSCTYTHIIIIINDITSRLINHTDMAKMKE